MIYNDEKQFAAHIKEKAFDGVYLLYGSENYLIELYRDKIAAGVGGGNFADFNLQTFSGKTGLDIDALADAVEAIPLMAGQKCVIVDDLDPDKLSAGDMAKLTQLLEDPSDTTVLVFTVRTSAFDVRKNGKAKKLQTLVNQKGKRGHVVELGHRETGDMVRFIRAMANRGGCDIPPDLCRALMERCGVDMLTLKSEIEKICAYAGGEGNITAAHIQAVTQPQVDAGIFDLSKAVMQKDHAKAMAIISDLIFLRNTPISILSALSFAFVDIYRAKIATARRIPESAAIQRFGYYGRDYRYKAALRQSAGFQVPYLRKALRLLAESDTTFKSARSDERALLETTVTKLFLMNR